MFFKGRSYGDIKIKNPGVMKYITLHGVHLIKNYLFQSFSWEVCHFLYLQQFRYCNEFITLSL